MKYKVRDFFEEIDIKIQNITARIDNLKTKKGADSIAVETIDKELENLIYFINKAKGKGMGEFQEFKRLVKDKFSNLEDRIEKYE